MAPLLSLAVAAFLAHSALAHPMGDHEHIHSSRGLPYTHNANVEHLFKRQQQGNYPPEDVPGPQPKQEWVTAYQTAVAAGLVPNFGPSVLANGWPAYAGNVDPNTICSWTVSKCTTGDVIDAPDGMAGISFDDGPQQPTATLLPFLKSINQTVTHFMIGSRILDNEALFTQAVQQENHIAVHTWSHPYMTTMTDMQVLGELGWTMQIIYDLSGFVPAFWRPPYGDVDARVRAIAKYVFGLTTVIWNQDTNDWCLSDGAGQGSACAPGSGPQNYNDLMTELRQFYGPTKSPGVIVLEHELAQRAVQGFIQIWPTIQQNGWDARAIPDLFGASWYQNAANGTATPSGMQDILPTSSSPFTVGSAIPSVNALVAPSSSASSSSSPSSSSSSTSTAAATPVNVVTSSIAAPSSTSHSSSHSSAATGRSFGLASPLFAAVAAVAALVA